MKASKRATRSPELVAPQQAGNGRARRQGAGLSPVGGRRRWLVAAPALVITAAVLAAIVISTSAPGSPKRVSPSVMGAATVERRDLAETHTELGTLSYANPRTVYNRLSGTFTWLPSVGEVIKPGQTLYEVNAQPVIVMDGTIPAYRDLTASDSDGLDILQLNRNLVELGFNPDGIVIDDAWQPATAAGVQALQASLGEAETGILTLGRIVFLPGDQLITTVDATLGDTGDGTSSGASSAAGMSMPLAAATPEFDSLESGSARLASGSSSTTTSNTSVPGSAGKTGSATASQALGGLIALLEAEATQLKAATAALKAARASSSSTRSSTSNDSNSFSPNPSTSSSASSSGDVAPTAILQTASTQLIVTVDLDASDPSEAKVGKKVMVEMPAGNVVNGEVTAVNPVAQSSSTSTSGTTPSAAATASSRGSGATIPVTITLSGHHVGTGLDEAPVKVNFVEAVANRVLSVPANALLATSGGGFAVQEAAAPHQLIPVTTGLFAAGYVQISGSRIYPGLRVTDSQR